MSSAQITFRSASYSSAIKCNLDKLFKNSKYIY